MRDYANLSTITFNNLTELYVELLAIDIVTKQPYRILDIDFNPYEASQKQAHQEKTLGDNMGKKLGKEPDSKGNLSSSG